MKTCQTNYAPLSRRVICFSLDFRPRKTLPTFVLFNNCNDFARTQAIFARIGLLNACEQRKVVVATCVPFISPILLFVGFLTPNFGFWAVILSFADGFGWEQIQFERTNLGKGPGSKTASAVSSSTIPSHESVIEKLTFYIQLRNNDDEDYD